MWLSLVEYLNGVQVAAGSNPVTPTNIAKTAEIRRFLLLLDFFSKTEYTI